MILLVFSPFWSPFDCCLLLAMHVECRDLAIYVRQRSGLVWYPSKDIRTSCADLRPIL